MLDKRWCIYIDILGFSKFWECDEHKALRSLNELMPFLGFGAQFRKSFALPSVVPGSVDQMHGHNGGLQGLLMRKLAVNRTGSIAVVNSTFRESTSSHIWLYRGRRSRH